MAAAAAAYRHEGDGPLADAATPTKRLQEGSPRRGGRTRMGTTARSPQNLALHNRAGLAPGGWRGKMASGQGNKYDEERQERIRGNNEALQKVVAERKELPNSRGSHHGSGSSDESQKNQKVLNVVVKLRKRRKERSERGKANWAKMSELHTTGSCYERTLCSCLASHHKVTGYQQLVGTATRRRLLPGRLAATIPAHGPNGP
uniref:Uncharacterized protein n=1 Tax=Oryza barthii TaxID=65489 RepID=A0A0D3GMI7_9ORYZ